MTKLRKMYWTNSKGERNINCYTVTIPKEVVAKSKVNVNKEVVVTADEKKIIIKENN